MFIDKDVIRENLRYFDKSVIVQIIDLFMEEYPFRFIELQENIIELDFGRINNNAHKLKGVVAYFSQEITQLAWQLEEHGKESNSEGLQQIFDELKAGTLQLGTTLLEMRPEYEM